VIGGRRYLRWVFEAKKRFGLSVLDYMVTCNHIHLLIKDTGPNNAAASSNRSSRSIAALRSKRSKPTGSIKDSRLITY